MNLDNSNKNYVCPPECLANERIRRVKIRVRANMAERIRHKILIDYAHHIKHHKRGNKKKYYKNQNVKHYFFQVIRSFVGRFAYGFPLDVSFTLPLFQYPSGYG